MEKNEHTMIHDPHSEKKRQSFNFVTGQKIRHTIKTRMDLASKKKIVLISIKNTCYHL